jgi:DNA mismatch endonuclease (patch repair protein)
MKMETALAKKRSDVFTKSKRSEVMSRIRSRGNKDTELALAKLFRRNKITGWRRHIQVRIAECRMRNNSKRGVAVFPLRIPQSKFRTFAVRPDFVFRQTRLAVFVDGCFWHGCPKHGTQPKGNRTFWRRKFSRNIARDRLVNQTLRRAGWRVLRIWEHDLHRATKRRATMDKRNEARLLRRIHLALI